MTSSLFADYKGLSGRFSAHEIIGLGQVAHETTSNVIGLFEEAPTLYTLPGQGDRNEFLIVATCLAASASSLCAKGDSASAGAWKSWLLTYILYMLPSMRPSVTMPYHISKEGEAFYDDFLKGADIRGGSHKEVAKKMKPLIRPADATGPISTWRSPPEDDGLASLYNSFGQVLTEAHFERIPKMTKDADIWKAFGTVTVEELYGHLSLIIFLAGKQITEENESAITERRPKAIIRSYVKNIREDSELLIGSMKISRVAAQQINYAWQMMPRLRYVVLKESSKFGAVSAGPTQVLMFKTIKLLSYAHMSHVALIRSFIVSFPWVSNFFPLAPYVSRFKAECQTFAELPSEFAPFYKIAMDDKTSLFRRAEYEPLIAVAVSHMEKTQPTWKNYAVGGQHASLISTFWQYAESRQIEDERRARKD